MPKPKRTMKEFEELLNNEYTPDEAVDMMDFQFPDGSVTKHAMGLLNNGKFGTALRKYKPSIFDREYLEWIKTSHQLIRRDYGI